MSLVSNVQARYSSQRLIALTNPDLPSASSVDSTRLSLAATDVENDFKIHCGVIYDDTDGRHVTTGVQGVILKLQMYLNNEDPAALNDRWLSMLRALAMVTGRDRVVPVTDSVLEPSSEASTDGSAVRPDFDRSRWRYITGGEPGGAGNDVDLD